MKLLHTIILTTLTAISSASFAATTLTYSTSNYSQGSIGQEPGYTGGYDVFSINGVSNQSLTFSGSTTAVIGQFAFDAER